MNFFQKRHCFKIIWPVVIHRGCTIGARDRFNTIFIALRGNILCAVTGSNDNNVLETFYGIFFIVILALPMNTVAFVFDGIFKGLGEMKYLRDILLIATFLGFIPVLYSTQYLGLGLTGIWLALTTWMAVRSSALVWKFRRKFRPLLQKA